MKYVQQVVWPKVSHCSYVRVRYEDLVSEKHNKDVLDELYKFMGITYDLRARNRTLGYLLHGKSHVPHHGYYTLVRGRDFDPNHWIKELSREVKNIIM